MTDQQLIQSLREEILVLKEGLQFYAEPWIKVGERDTGPVIGHRYNEQTGECNMVPVENVVLGIYEPPRQLQGLKHYKALRHLMQADRIRKEREGV